MSSKILSMIVDAKSATDRRPNETAEENKPWTIAKGSHLPSIEDVVPSDLVRPPMELPCYGSSAVASYFHDASSIARRMHDIFCQPAIHFHISRECSVLDYAEYALRFETTTFRGDRALIYVNECLIESLRVDRRALHTRHMFRSSMMCAIMKSLTGIYDDNGSVYMVALNMETGEMDMQWVGNYRPSMNDWHEYIAKLDCWGCVIYTEESPVDGHRTIHIEKRRL